MSDLERAFLQQIDAEPENALHRLVYADWLEEQGSEKAGQIRAWEAACESEAEADRQRLTELVGEFWLVFQRLPLHQQRLGAVEFAWRALPAFEMRYALDNRPRLAIIATWRHLQGDSLAGLALAVEGASQSARVAREDRLTEARAHTITAANYLEWYSERAEEKAAGAARAAARAAERSGDDARRAARAVASLSMETLGEPERHRQQLIAVSYELFGVNLLPGRFDLEQARKGLR